ncbi:MAG: LLM class F420-dependent oxidoreductase [Dehalococcoidia bacterium]|nr:LLM class F420-dependent oxidoreductase [Dehalococcoidia bacterium]MDW8120386.1 LLM class F420-dependent oxidoreductase [Chloroflexota bacterium]
MFFGLAAPHFRQVASVEALQRVAREAEALGYHSLWVTDHILLPKQYHQRFGAEMLEMVPVLGYLAAITQRIRLGTSVVILAHRNPIFMARALATVDVLSGGRLIVGAAAGWCKEEFEFLGIPFDQRGEISDETLRIYKVLWTQDEPHFEGKFWRFSNTRAEPKPVQKPHPPIWIGGNSRRALRRAIELGDGWHPTRPSPQDILAARPILQRLAEQRGRRLDHFPIVVRHPLKFTDTPSPQFPLIGPPDSIRRGIEEFQKAGVDGFMLDTFYSVPAVAHETVDTILRTIERFAREVMPHFR